jgi:hypothetical protein
MVQKTLQNSHHSWHVHHVKGKANIGSSLFGKDNSPKIVGVNLEEKYPAYCKVREYFCMTTFNENHEIH